jgi:hypothetical protein
VLGIATGPSEAEPFWKAFLRSLADRGLSIGVQRGPTIGAQKGTTLRFGAGLMRGAHFALAQA